MSFAWQPLALKPAWFAEIDPFPCAALSHHYPGMSTPDGYTLVPYRGKPAADAPRYKAIGNSMAVPNIAWLGQRLLRALA